MIAGADKINGIILECKAVCEFIDDFGGNHIMIINTINDGWVLRKGFLDSVGMLEYDKGTAVSLPHDSMIATEVSPTAPAGSDSGYFNGDACNYTKYVTIPKEWEKDSVGLKFDGAMMHVTVDINGGRVAEHHYGYSPFYVDITPYVAFGGENRITINANTGIQPSSRWYTGCGLFRGLTLLHGPKLHVADDGIYLYTKEVADDVAFLQAEIDVSNETDENRLAEVTVSLYEENGEGKNNCPVTSVKRVIQVNPKTRETAYMAVNLKSPKLWNVDSPNLYRVKVQVVNKGVYRTHFEADENPEADVAETLFGVRTITADSVRGLRINGKTVKLKGGCLHHDNGLLGAASFYESEKRKVLKLKDLGFNAIRTAHNPPSKALVEACDRLGMFIFDEAFDAWGMGKRIGDYSQYFAKCWEDDLTAFVRRDRVHPSVIMWSTGNEIPERGGLNNGYRIATALAEKIRSLDGSRHVSHGTCSHWCGLDDYLATGQNQNQNAKPEDNEDLWEKRIEPFTNGMDIVGYNYMELAYERDHELYPERVILGSENFPQEIGFRWPKIEELPYVIGEFTWTAWDYIGEAGIGKAVYVDKDDPIVKGGPWALMPQGTTHYPWRTANDADFDITGRMLPQGAYRSVVWGSKETHLYSFHPDFFGKTQVMSMWGFPKLDSCWNYREYEGKPIELVVFSNAEEVELLINGRIVERKPVCMDRPFPNSVRFETVFEAGTVEAVSYCGGKEISRDTLETSKKAAKIRLTPEKNGLKSDGQDLMYVNIDILDEDGKIVTDAGLPLKAVLTGTAGEDKSGAVLAGFGSGNPITEENYTDDEATTYKGHACAIIRSGCTPEKLTLQISCGDMKEAIMFSVD